MLFPRKLQKMLLASIDCPEIIVVTGMRRVGKTTLCQAIFESLHTSNKLFIDLENPLNQKLFEETNYDNIPYNLRALGLNPEKQVYLFLDEIQAMPSIVKIVKYLYDHFKFKFFLTGSSSYYLKNLFPESLSGRKFVFELFPLDFEEFLTFRSIPKETYTSFSQKDTHKNLIRAEKLKALYEEFISYGGFPQVVMEPDPSRKKWHLEDIFKSYFEKDVQSLAKFREINLFRDLILLLMARTGSKLDIGRLSTEIGTSRETIYSYLRFLQDTFFISLIPPFTKKADKLVAKSKKVYMCDTGFLQAFSHITSGALFENAVYNTIRHYGTISYYQKQSTREIDFIINGEIGLEVKLKGTAKDMSALVPLASTLELKEYYILTKEFVNKPGFIAGIDL